MYKFLLSKRAPSIAGGGVRVFVRGVLVERWVRGCAAQIECPFGLSGLPVAPFLFENWFRCRSRFLQNAFPLVYQAIGCRKILMHPNLHGKKYCLVFFFKKKKRSFTKQMV